MAAWWDALSVLEKFFYFIAIPATLILVIQFILSIIGLAGSGDVDADADFDGDMDTDADLDGDGAADLGQMDFRLVSFRTIIAFLTVFPWTGIALLGSTLPVGVVLLLSALAGLAAMAVVGYLFFVTARLQYSGNISYKNAVGKTAEVYIPLLKENNYSGKVQVIIQGRLVEATAVARDQKEHKTGEMVRTVGISGLTTLLVETDGEAE